MDDLTMLHVSPSTLTTFVASPICPLVFTQTEWANAITTLVAYIPIGVLGIFLSATHTSYPHYSQ